MGFQHLYFNKKQFTSSLMIYMYTLTSHQKSYSEAIVHRRNILVYFRVGMGHEVI